MYCPEETLYVVRHSILKTLVELNNQGIEHSGNIYKERSDFECTRKHALTETFCGPSLVYPPINIVFVELHV